MFQGNNIRKARKGSLLRGCAAVCGVWAVASCREPIEANLADESLTNLDADGVMYGMVNYVTSNGVRSAVIRADSTYQFNDSSVVHMWGVEMTLYHEDGRERAHVTSERGRLHDRTQDMLARGNVVLTIFEGNRIVRSPELTYQPDLERISSDSASVLIQDGRETRGTCFRSDLSFREITVCQIRGSADLPGGRGGGGGGGP